MTNNVGRDGERRARKGIGIIFSEFIENWNLTYWVVFRCGGFIVCFAPPSPPATRFLVNIDTQNGKLIQPSTGQNAGLV